LFEETDVSFTPIGRRTDAFLFSQRYGTAEMASRRSSEYILPNAAYFVSFITRKVQLAPRSMRFPGIVSSLTATGTGTVAVFTEIKAGIVMWRTEDASQRRHSWPTEVNIRRELRKPSHSAWKALAMPDRDPRVC
jgi:hypothetical protein